MPHLYKLYFADCTNAAFSQKDHMIFMCAEISLRLNFRGLPVDVNESSEIQALQNFYKYGVIFKHKI